MSRSVSVVNLEHGLPTVSAAMAHLQSEIGGAKLRGAKVLRVIHGYGSSGKGGKIRKAVQARLPELKKAGTVADYIFGSDYDEFNVPAVLLRDRFPELKKSFADDRANPGITFIVL